MPIDKASILPSYQKLALPLTIYDNICQLASIILEIPSNNVSLLQIPTRLSYFSESSPESTTWIEQLLNHHLSSSTKKELIIENSCKDERSQDLPSDLLSEYPTFIAFFPIVDSLDIIKGILMVSDTKARTIDSKELKGLMVLAEHTVSLMENEKEEKPISGEFSLKENSGIYNTFSWKLKQSERQLKKSADIAKLGYWSVNLKDFSISWSNEVYSIWGRDKETFVLNYDNFLATVHPDDRAKFPKEKEQAFTGNAELDNIYRIILPNGASKWIHGLGQIILDEHGAPSIFEGTVQDVTKQKKEEQHLRLLESVVTNTREAVLITEAEPYGDDGRRIIYVNQAFLKMTGYTEKEILGKTTSALKSPNVDLKELERMEQAMSRWEPFDITITSKNKLDEDYWVNCVVNPVADENGRYTHWISIERDVTVMKNNQFQKKILNEIGVLFNSDKVLESCLMNVLQHLIKRTLYSTGQLWLPSPDKTTLSLVAEYPKNKKVKSYLKNSANEATFKYGEGLPGVVSKKKVIAVWDSIEKETTFKRVPATDTSCRQAVLGIPLIHNDKVKGVLVLGIENRSKSPKFHGQLFIQLQTYLGAEIKRKSLEIELNEIFKFTPDIICKIGEDGLFKKINPAATQLLGYSEKELVTSNFIEFVHPDDKKETAERLSRIYRGKSIQYFENRYQTKDGRTKWLSWTASQTQEKGITYAVAKDITENKGLKQLLKDVTDLAHIGAWEINYQNNTVFWSEMTKKIHEVDTDYVPTLQSILSFYKDLENSKRFSELIQHTLHKGKAFDDELSIITEKGKERWVRVIGKPEFINSKCTRIYGSFQDISDRIAFEKEIMLSNERFLRVSQATNDAIWDWNIPENTLFLGDAFKSLFGHTVRHDTQKIKFWEDLLHPKDKKRVMNTFYKAMDDSTINIWEAEYRFLKKSGNYAYVWDKGTVIRNKEGKAIRMIGSMADITFRQQYEESLRQLNHELQEHALNIEAQNKKLRDIAWTQSHVVRAPLSRLMGLIYLIKDELIPAKEKTELLDHIYTSALEFDVIIRDIVEKSNSVISDDQ